MTEAEYCKQLSKAAKIEAAASHAKFDAERTYNGVKTKSSYILDVMADGRWRTRDDVLNALKGKIRIDKENLRFMLNNMTSSGLLVCELAGRPKTKTYRKAVK